MRRAPLFLAALLTATAALAQSVTDDPEDRVIRYRSSDDLADPVSLLQRRLSRGEASLEFEEAHGRLVSLLRLLNVPVSSQGLVFSRTSSQRQRIGPRTPRAVYFSDSVYVGWVPGGDVIEVAGIDPRKGVIFFALDQRAPVHDPPRFTRREECLQCHDGPDTLGVPGLVVRSVLTAPDGSPISEVHRFVSGHRSPLKERWGGWYVTGTHAGDLHLGNAVLLDRAHPEKMDLLAGANVVDLGTRIDASRYLSRQSDIVALLVLEHQVRMQNLITRVGYETRFALDQRAALAGKRGDAAGEMAAWTERRIAAAVEDLLEYMLFRDEAALKGPVVGTSEFAREFQRGGPRDAKGRSLRQLDLKRRLLRYPCSYLIYSASFDALPQEAKDLLWRRLFEILSGKDRSATYATMTRRDRAAVLEILRDTKPEFAARVAGGASPPRVW